MILSAFIIGLPAGIRGGPLAFVLAPLFLAAVFLAISVSGHAVALSSVIFALLILNLTIILASLLSVFGSGER